MSLVEGLHVALDGRRILDDVAVYIDAVALSGWSAQRQRQIDAAADLAPGAAARGRAVWLEDAGA